MADGLELGTGPVSLGVDFADALRQPALADGARRHRARPATAGRSSARSATCPDDLLPELAARGLGLTAGFVFEPLHDSPRAMPTAAARAVAERVARARRAVPRRHRCGAPPIAPAPRAGRRQPPGSTATAATPAVDDPRDRGASPRASGCDRCSTPTRARTSSSRTRSSRCSIVIELCLDTGHWLYAGHDPVARLRALGRPDPVPAPEGPRSRQARRRLLGIGPPGAFRPLGDG